MNTIIQCPTCKKEFDYVNGEDVVVENHVPKESDSTAVVCVCGEVLMVDRQRMQVDIMTVSTLVRSGLPYQDVIKVIAHSHDNWQISRKENSTSA